MFDFMFFVKTMVVTVLIVSLMQIKAGQTTVETQATQWIRTSTILQPLHTTAAAGAKAISDSAKWLSFNFQKQTRKFFGSNKSGPGEKVALKFKRSAAYERDQEAKQEAALQKMTEETESE